MLDPILRPLIDPPLERIGDRLARAGVRADQVTLVGFSLGVGAVLALAWRLDMLALALLLANRVFDGLDGAVARKSRPTDFGAYLDILLDFVFYSGVAFGFAVGRPEHALPAAFLIFSFVGSGTAFLAFAVIAAKRRLETTRRGRKSFFHVGGLAEGSETIAALALICLFPGAFPAIAWIFGAICWITAIGRVAAARRAFGAE